MSAVMYSVQSVYPLDHDTFPHGDGQAELTWVTAKARYTPLTPRRRNCRVVSRRRSDATAV